MDKVAIDFDLEGAFLAFKKSDVIPILLQFGKGPKLLPVFRSGELLAATFSNLRIHYDTTKRLSHVRDFVLAMAVEMPPEGLWIAVDMVATGPRDYRYTAVDLKTVLSDFSGGDA